MTQLNVEETHPVGNLVSFHGWLGELNRTRATGHQWRKRYPWLAAGVKNVFGKLYITRETIAEFERRAIAGEFARDQHGACAKWANQ